MDTFDRTRHWRNLWARSCSSPLLAEEGWGEIIITGRSLAQIKETAAQLAAETKTQIFTPLGLDLNDPVNVQSAVAALVKQGRPVDFLLLNAGLVPFKAARAHCGGRRGISGPAHRPSPTGCRVAQYQPS